MTHPAHTDAQLLSAKIDAELGRLEEKRGQLRKLTTAIVIARLEGRDRCVAALENRDVTGDADTRYRDVIHQNMCPHCRAVLEAMS